MAPAPKSSEARAVTPLTGAAPYIGGKRNLAAQIIQRIEAIPHVTYAEPFVGMGGVFFRRRFAPPVEVINDRSRDVATFFRVLQRHYVPFVEMMRWQLKMRAEFERLARTDPDTLTDLERAARFFYLQRNSFGGKVDGRTFGIGVTESKAFDITRIVPQLEELHARLSAVVIECLDFAVFLERYDRPTTLFYLDPPYIGCENDYGRGLFSEDNFVTLAAKLQTLQGRFIMSINDVPLARDLFAVFDITPVRTTYSVAQRSTTPARELLISNAAA